MLERPEHVERILEMSDIRSGKVLTNEEVRDVVVRFADILSQNGIRDFQYNECLNGLAVAVENALQHIKASPEFFSGGAYPEWSSARVAAGLPAEGVNTSRDKKVISLRKLNKLTWELAFLLEQKGISSHFPFPYFWELRANIVEEAFGDVGVRIRGGFEYNDSVSQLFWF